MIRCIRSSALFIYCVMFGGNAFLMQCESASAFDPPPVQAEALDEEANQASLARTLAKILAQQTMDWNRGDIDAFMAAYWKSEKLTFCSGGETQRGWKTTRDRYKARYPDSKAMGTLKFTELESTPLGTDAALMIGRWQLQRESPIGGNFSLVWRRIEGQWFIVHDHSSALP